jgi:hypothetical protein
MVWKYVGDKIPPLVVAARDNTKLLSKLSVLKLQLHWNTTYRICNTLLLHNINNKQRRPLILNDNVYELQSGTVICYNHITFNTLVAWHFYTSTVNSSLGEN